MMDNAGLGLCSKPLILLVNAWSKDERPPSDERREQEKYNLVLELYINQNALEGIVRRNQLPELATVWCHMGVAIQEPDRLLYKQQFTNDRSCP